MKYAFYPGCVSRGACPELYTATLAVCEILEIELDEAALEGESSLRLIQDGQISKSYVDPSEMGLSIASIDSLSFHWGLQ